MRVSGGVGFTIERTFALRRVIPDSEPDVVPGGAPLLVVAKRAEVYRSVGAFLASEAADLVVRSVKRTQPRLPWRADRQSPPWRAAGLKGRQQKLIMDRAARAALLRRWDEQALASGIG